MKASYETPPMSPSRGKHQRIVLIKLKVNSKKNLIVCAQEWKHPRLCVARCVKGQRYFTPFRTIGLCAVGQGTSPTCVNRIGEKEDWNRQIDLVTVPLDTGCQSKVMFLEISTQRSDSTWALCQALRYLDSRTDREGEKCGPLNHVLQIPFSLAKAAPIMKVNFKQQTQVGGWPKYNLSTLKPS